MTPRKPLEPLTNEQQQMIASVMPFLHKVWIGYKRRWNPSEFVAEKMYDYLINTLISSARRFDSSYHNSFFTYAGACLRKKALAAKYVSGFSIRHLSDKFLKLHGKSENNRNELCNMVDNVIDVCDLTACLDEDEMTYINAYFGINGHRAKTYKEYAKIIGVNQQTVSKRINRIIEKLRMTNNIDINKVS